MIQITEKSVVYEYCLIVIDIFSEIYICIIYSIEIYRQQSNFSNITFC